MYVYATTYTSASIPATTSLLQVLSGYQHFPLYYDVLFVFPLTESSYSSTYSCSFTHSCSYPSTALKDSYSEFATILVEHTSTQYNMTILEFEDINVNVAGPLGLDSDLILPVPESLLGHEREPRFWSDTHHLDCRDSVLSSRRRRGHEHQRVIIIIIIRETCSRYS